MRCHTIRIGHKLEGYRTATIGECGVHLSEQLFICWNVEVMKEIREQYDIITRPKINIERTSRECRILTGNTGGCGIALCHFENAGPVLSCHFDLGILLGKVDAEEAMSRSDIKHFYFPSGISWHELRDYLGRHCHESGHRLSKLDPNRILDANGSLIMECC